MDLDQAYRASLERSRARRRSVTVRLAAVRRRRRRSGGATAAVVAGALALGAPLALGQETAQDPAPVLLKSGSRGDQVRALQRALDVRASGRYDAATARAVRRFQRREGLDVDGVAGPQTLAALGITLPAGDDDAAAPVPEDAAATLARIAQCESGGDPTAISADGRYRGKYQFARETWERLGGEGDPAAAPEAEQDRLAALLLAQEGTTPWPTCAAGSP